MGLRIPSEVQVILKQRVKHEQKIELLNVLLEKNPECTVVYDFVRAEELLVKKKGMAAADLYGEIGSKAGDPRWLLERQAKTYAKYAYFDIGSGPIHKAFAIFTTKLDEEPEKAWKKIADVLKNMKGWGYAGQCYANAGMPGTAARMFEKTLKEPQRAAFYYEKAEEWLSAARMYKKAKLFDKAGNCYAQGGLLKNAVKLWKKAGTLEKHNIGEQTMENILRK
jgi:tetratricopeptide (TPR) repeat protein